MLPPRALLVLDQTSEQCSRGIYIGRQRKTKSIRRIGKGDARLSFGVVVTLWPLDQRSRVQSQSETVPFPIGKAAENEGSFGKAEEDDGEGSPEGVGGR